LNVHVIGASGRSGARLCRALRGDFVPVVRDAARWGATGLPGTPRLANLDDAQALRVALDGAARVVCCAHARHAAAVIAAAPPGATLVFLGSTRKFTRWPDEHGDGVRRGEAAFLASGRRGVMLHPTMIYGAQGENNVQRLAALLRRLPPRGRPIVPLPAGGRALVQPIHQDDVTAAILAALAIVWHDPRSVVIAGPEPVSYAEFVRLIAAAAGLPPPRIVALPVAPLLLAAPLIGLLPWMPRVDRAEIRRLLEDKAFDIGAMRRILGIAPLPLAEGLARLFARSQNGQIAEGERAWP
jgi:nucleoside-diphosphate-sugar epimerase